MIRMIRSSKKGRLVSTNNSHHSTHTSLLSLSIPPVNFACLKKEKAYKRYQKGFLFFKRSEFLFSSRPEIISSRAPKISLWDKIVVHFTAQQVVKQQYVINSNSFLNLSLVLKAILIKQPLPTIKPINSSNQLQHDCVVASYIFAPNAILPKDEPTKLKNKWGEHAFIEVTDYTIGNINLSNMAPQTSLDGSTYNKVKSISSNTRATSAIKVSNVSISNTLFGSKREVKVNALSNRCPSESIYLSRNHLNNKRTIGFSISTSALQADSGRAHQNPLEQFSDKVEKEGSNSKYMAATVCNCPPNVICMVGELINSSTANRRKWVHKKRKKFIDSLSTVEGEREYHLSNLNHKLKYLEEYNFCAKSKIIDIDSYFESQDLLNSTVTNNSVLKPSTEGELSQFDCAFTPIIAVFLNTKSGKRLFLESAGLSPYTQKTTSSGESYSHYIMHNNKIIPLEEYKEILASEIPSLKKDYQENPTDFDFHVLEIGQNYACELKRKALVKDLSVEAGVLTYNYYCYGNEKYGFKDLLKAQRACFLCSNTQIPLNRAVHLGYSGCDKIWYRGGTYRNVIEAAYVNCRCRNQIIYGLFLQSGPYRNWYVISDRYVNTINKAKLTSLNIKPIKNTTY